MKHQILSLTCLPIPPYPHGWDKDTNKPREKSKLACIFSEAKYLRRSQRYEKSSAEASVSSILPRRSIYGASQSTNKRGQKQTRLHFAETNYLRSSQREPKFFDPQPCGAVGTRKRFGNRRRSSWRKGTVAYIEYIKASACDRRHCGRDTDR